MRTTVIYSTIAWLSFAALVIILLLPYNTPEDASIRVMSLVLPQMVLFFLNLNYLSPVYLDNEKKSTYFVLLGIVIILYTILTSFMDIALDRAYPISIHHFSDRPISAVFFGRLMSSVPAIVISALISRTILLRKQSEESLELKNKMLEAETKALKAQINPHFLFNSLNNIYALSQVKSDKTPDAVMQLSELLRYVTYDGNQQKVQVEKEIRAIESFIELQRLKDDNFENVSIDIQLDGLGQTIEPLLLIPFIENAFKHSNFEDKQNGWISIQLDLQNNHLQLIVKNSVTENHQSTKDAVGGVGMENVKKRLNLLYPDQHQLKIRMDRETFEVELNLSLEEK